MKSRFLQAESVTPRMFYFYLFGDNASPRFLSLCLDFCLQKIHKKILPPHSKRGDEHSQNIPSTRGIGTNSPRSSLQVEMLHTTVRVKRDKYTISARISLTTINNDMKLILVMHRTGVKYPLTNVVDAVQRGSSPSPSHCIHLIRRVRDRRICGPCVMLFELLIALALCHRRFALAVVLMCRRVFVLAESFATRVGLPRLVYKKSGSMSLWRQELVPLLSLTAFCFYSSLFQKSVDYSAVSRFLD